MSDTREIFDAITDAVNRHDSAGAAAQYSPTVVITSPDGAFTGRDQARDYLRSFIEAFPDLHLGVWSKVTSGELVCDEWTMTGTHTGPLPLPDGTAVAPTGRSVTVRGCDVAAVENGQVISHRMYFDQAELLTQLGLGS